MKMTYKISWTLLSLGTALLLAAPAPAQSLAELARQTRAKKAQAPPSGKVFTNDSIPPATISGAPAAPAPTPAAAPEAGTAAPEGAAPAAEAAEAAEPTLEELEKEYREKFAALKENLDTEERRLDVLQRELNLAQQQFYSDPQVALREQYSREEINKRTEEIEAQKTVVEKAQQAIEDLETELRQKSLPIGWAR
jgi:predicted RNase H-like nuclease (RuvC/YqgF family)